MKINTRPSRDLQGNLSLISPLPLKFGAYEYTYFFWRAIYDFGFKFIKTPISVATGLNLPVDHFNSIGLVSLLRVRLRCLLVKFSGEKQNFILEKIEIEILLHA
jgi:hypothetical protein